MNDSKNDTVIFLERDKFFLYAAGVILNLGFPSNVCSDLDVKNRELLLSLVTNFIQSNKIEPTQILFVLSEGVCFSKDFPIKDSVDTTKVDEAAQNFIDAVPFGVVLSKIYRTPTFHRVVATNLDLVDTIVDAFTARGFGLSAIVPANIYPEYGATRDLTVDFAKHIIDTRENMKISSMIDGKDEASENHNEVSTSTAKESKSKLLPYLIIGFVVLLIILISVIVMRR